MSEQPTKATTTAFESGDEIHMNLSQLEPLMVRPEFVSDREKRDAFNAECLTRITTYSDAITDWRQHTISEAA